MQTSQKTHLRKISRTEFDKLFPNRPLLEKYTGELVEWFANEANNTLGANRWTPGRAFETPNCPNSTAIRD